MDSPQILQRLHSPLSKSRTALKSEPVIPSFAGNLARPSACKLRYTGDSVFRTKGRYYEGRQGMGRVQSTMKRQPLSIQHAPVRGRILSIACSRLPDAAEHIRTHPNRTERDLRLNNAEKTRKNLKEPETQARAIPCKTLEIRSRTTSRKKVPRKPEIVSAARISSRSANAVPFRPARRSRDPAHE